jgi:thiol-disulfide isomerase/thioredoxin
MRKSLLLALAVLAPLLADANSGAAGEMQPFVRGSWQHIRAAHAGRPFVVHFWGVTCGPCRVEMPSWGKLLAERPNLDLVLINADLVPDEPKAAFAMLAKAGLANAENWIFDDGFAERLRYEIDPRWSGEIPLTYLIGRDGARTTIEGVADLAKIRQWLGEQDASRPNAD